MANPSGNAAVRNAAYLKEVDEARKRYLGLPGKQNVRTLAAMSGVSKKGFAAEKGLPANVERHILDFISELAPGRRPNSNDLVQSELNTIRGRRESRLRELARAREEEFVNQLRERQLITNRAMEAAVPADAVIPETRNRPLEQARIVAKSRARRGKSVNFRSKAPKPFAGNKTKRRNRSHSRGKAKGKGSK